jgi:hypothetical protein
MDVYSPSGLTHPQVINMMKQDWQFWGSSGNLTITPPLSWDEGSDGLVLEPPWAALKNMSLDRHRPRKIEIFDTYQV